VQHDVRLEAGDAREALVANGAGEVHGGVRGPVEREVELHVECLRALVTTMRLQGGRGGEKERLKTVVNSGRVTELQTSPHSSTYSHSLNILV